MRKLTVLIMLVAIAAVALAQQPSKPAATSPQDNPLSTWNKMGYAQSKFTLLRAAEKVPEENYGFRPTDAVRTYGQILGHVADSQYAFCSAVRGEKDPNPNIEKTKTSKADLIAALKEAFAYCDTAYDSINDTSGTQAVKYQRTDMPKLIVLMSNVTHNAEHYGNLVTYMRLKNIVPPTSEPGFMQQLMQQMMKK